MSFSRVGVGWVRVKHYVEVLLGVKDMSGSWQDRDFSFGYMESENEGDSKKGIFGEQIHPPEQSKRFQRSVYGKVSGQYVGEQGLFSALLFLVVGFSILSAGIFAFFSGVFHSDDQYFLLFLSCVSSLPCNILGVISLLAYFTGIGPEKGRGGEDKIEKGIYNDY